MDRGVWQATAHGAARVRHNLATKPPPEANKWMNEDRYRGRLPCSIPATQGGFVLIEQRMVVVSQSYRRNHVCTHGLHFKNTSECYVFLKFPLWQILKYVDTLCW